MRLSTVIALAGVISAAGELAAQTPRPDVVRLRWAGANAVVFSDSTCGLTLWAATTADALVDGRPGSRDIYHRYRPEDVAAWLPRARAMLADVPTPDDTATLISSGVLRTAGGKQAIILARRRTAARFEAMSRVGFVADSGGPIVFELAASEVEGLLDALERAIPGSRYASAQADTLIVERDDDLGTPAARRHDSPHPSYPEALRQRNVTGEVWTQFAVSAEGRANPASLAVLLSDHPLFELAVRNNLRRMRFHPARRHGAPTSQLVLQRFIFNIAPRSDAP